MTNKLLLLDKDGTGNHDRPEDEAAAKAAGFDFLWADAWVKDRSWLD